MLALYIVALTAEVVGLTLAAVGLRRTWREFRQPDDAFWEPVTAPTSAAARWTRRHIRRLIGRAAPPATVRPEGIGVSITLGTPTVSATGWATPPADDTKAYVEYLSRRLEHLSEQVREMRSQVQSNASLDAERHAEATSAISQVRDEVHSQVRTITVGGLREQAAGWLLIVIGTILGGLGNILSVLQ